MGSCNFSVPYNFHLAESARVQFRGEVFNIVNRANFYIPQDLVNASRFGAIFRGAVPET